MSWPLPLHIIDLYAEFRQLTSGLALPAGSGLLGALIYHGLPGMAFAEKDSMRELAMRGPPFTEAEKRSLLDYCQQDVDSTARLLWAMLPKIDLGQALLRGRYTVAAARMEWIGVPIDVEELRVLRDNWAAIRTQLVDAVDINYGVYVRPKTGGPPRFSSAAWKEYVKGKGILWPRLDSGALALDDDTFRQMARSYPKEIGPIRELRFALGRLRLNKLTVGSDGRNRVLLSVFGSKTGRNQPSNSKSVFGPATWLRHLIRPGPGRALCYCDWSQQELAIAARLSGDRWMQEAYVSGDFYLTFARMAGAVPPSATKQSHPAEREQFKTVALGVLYGLSAEGIANRLGVPRCWGRHLLHLHRRTFRDFWEWSDAVENHALLHGRLETCYGWRVNVRRGLDPETHKPLANPRSLRNFPMQASGAEMMRLAACLTTEQGIDVCAPIHDALLVEGPERLIGDVVARTQDAMRQASLLVLPDFPLGTDVKVVRHPRRFTDKRGAEMWQKVWELIDKEERRPYLLTGE
jgi:hypothetical protein